MSLVNVVAPVWWTCRGNGKLRLPSVSRFSAVVGGTYHNTGAGSRHVRVAPCRSAVYVVYRGLQTEDTTSVWSVVDSSPL